MPGIKRQIRKNAGNGSNIQDKIKNRPKPFQDFIGKFFPKLQARIGKLKKN